MGNNNEFTIIFLKGEELVDAWWYVGTVEGAISTGRKSLMGYGCNGFKVVKYSNPDIVYFSQEGVKHD